MSKNTIEKVREYLRNNNTGFMKGRVNKADGRILDAMRTTIKEELMAVLRVLFDDNSSTEQTNGIEALTNIFIYMGKAYLRCKKKFESENDEFKLTSAEIDAFFVELPAMGELFFSHGIRVDEELLQSVMISGGLDYWKNLLEDDFAKKQLGVVRYAAIHYSDPRAFLKQVEETVQTILNEEEFASLKKTSWVVLHAATHYKDPRAFLKKVNQTVQDILNEEEFASFTDLSWIVLHAVVNKPKNPRAFLRNEKQWTKLFH